MANAKNTLGHALLQAFGLDDQRVKRLRLDIEAGDVPLLTVTVYPRDVSAQQIEAIATEYEIISRSEMLDIRERLAAVQQAQEALECHADVGIKADKAITALKAALAEPEPRNQCAETCERAKLCAVCARGLAEPVQRKPATGAESCVPSPSFQMNAQAEPVQRKPARWTEL